MKDAFKRRKVHMCSMNSAKRRSMKGEGRGQHNNKAKDLRNPLTEDRRKYHAVSPEVRYMFKPEPDIVWGQKERRGHTTEENDT